MSDAKPPSTLPQGKKLFSVNAVSRRERTVLARSVILEETTPPNYIFSGIWLIFAILLVASIWAALTRLDERAGAPGEIVTITTVTPIQHLEGGIVSDVPVADGDIVQAGDVLVRLDPTAARAEYDQLRAREASLALQIARLRATAFGEKPEFGDYPELFPDLYEDQKTAYESDVTAMQAQAAVADAQVRARLQELEGLKGRQASLEEQLAALEEQLALQQDLSDRQLGRRTVLLDTQRQVAQLRGDIQQVVSDQARAEAAIAEAEGRKLEVKEAMRAQALDRLGGLSGERAEVQERISRLQDRFARTEIRAPLSGVVAGLKLARGSVIAPGDVLMRIVPANDMIRAQVRVSPSDIGYVKRGQPALVKIDTYSFSRLGGVPGQVERISATSFKDPEGRSYFEALVSLDQDYVGPDPLANRITPGMTLVADIKTGEKSLLSYLWRPVSRSLQDAFGER